ncbi:iron complex transport system substrate-binding protein [Arthrobacter sp. V4I6]|uniref:ABC transporter substrate-binding protein n=1 Tax=unclassified Arthrobacter TaxID=235627 RepID=UPI00278A4F1D|nr:MULTISPECIES: iron-siderophore ABC transporter substrate-binding protein [unclassified Arthrobacter]MDQ0820957.1 iron complex transport system substrate-binding protein [Arthrobacter sp. V1I7]MDQ0855218.1 iron complex transport system substrate-binding protein [Arthrobacter sp. V4I6]
MKTRILKQLSAVTAGLALLATAACGAPAATTETTTAAAASAGFPLTMQHTMGSTSIEAVPKRVVALDPSYIDAALLLGADLVGYVQYRQDPNAPFAPYLGDVADATKDSVNVGTLAEPNLEKILELKPDLVVSAKVRHEALYPQLSKIAPTIFSVSTGPTWKENVVFLGEALGKKDKAEELVKAYEDRAQKVGADILAKKPDATYSLVRFTGGDTARLYSSKSFIGEIMTDMSIPRPKDAPDSDKEIFVPLSAEQILQGDAGLVMVSAFTPAGAEGDKARAQQEKFESNPLWQRLQGEVIHVDDATFLASVSIQGAHAVITDLAKRYGVDPRLP